MPFQAQARGCKVSCDAESFQCDDDDDTDYQTESGVEDDLTLGVRSVDHFRGSNANSIAVRSGMDLKEGCDNRPPLPIPREEEGGDRSLPFPTAVHPYHRSARAVPASTWARCLKRRARPRGCLC